MVATTPKAPLPGVPLYTRKQLITVGPNKGTYLTETLVEHVIAQNGHQQIIRVWYLADEVEGAPRPND